MLKFKKAAAVAAMVGGLGLVSSGVASANDDPFDINNLQVVDCEQNFDPGTAFVPIGSLLLGDANQNIGNFCTVIGSVD
ncbi:hypothetical protein OG604_47355 [Streptomyces sp. NBC_01231]|nr:hypothetical protein OG604_47355 [Streptomyces sp. NBC_01231]